MLVWIQNEGTGKWSKETRENQSIRDLYKGFEMRGDRYLALALVLKPKDGYRVEVYKVTEFETEEVDSFFAALLSEVTEKLNEWSSTGPLTPLRPKISKIKAVLGGDSFVQNPVQKSEKGSYLIPQKGLLKQLPVLSAKPKSVACKPQPCEAVACVPCAPCDTKKWEDQVRLLQTEIEVLKKALDESKTQAQEYRYEENIAELKNELKESKKTATSIQTTIAQLLPYGEAEIKEAKKKGGETTTLSMTLAQIDETLKNAAKKIINTFKQYKEQIQGIAKDQGLETDSKSIGQMLQSIKDAFQKDSQESICKNTKAMNDLEDYILHLVYFISKVAKENIIRAPTSFIVNNNINKVSEISKAITKQLNTLLNRPTIPKFLLQYYREYLNKIIVSKLYNVVKTKVCDGTELTEAEQSFKFAEIKDEFGVVRLLNKEDVEELRKDLNNQIKFFTEDVFVTYFTSEKAINYVLDPANPLLTEGSIDYVKLRIQWFLSHIFSEADKWWSVVDKKEIERFLKLENNEQINALVMTNQIKTFLNTKKDTAIKQLEEFKDYQSKQSIIPKPTK